MKPPKLTSEEKRLLAYPPTEQTWYCPSHSTESGAVKYVTNAGTDDACWLCHRPKPRRAPLVWPIYQKALTKKELILAARRD